MYIIIINTDIYFLMIIFKKVHLLDVETESVQNVQPMTQVLSIVLSEVAVIQELSAINK